VPQRPSIVKEIEGATGLVQETRREGVAMIDPDELMTDVKMPEEGTDGHCHAADCRASGDPAS